MDLIYRAFKTLIDFIFVSFFLCRDRDLSFSSFCNKRLFVLLVVPSCIVCDKQHKKENFAMDADKILDRLESDDIK